ncbi:MAG: MFS transporter, partial [Chloroflexi bacterium]|nr:MFS transporter [Chloroflexota bacterium]
MHRKLLAKRPPYSIYLLTSFAFAVLLQMMAVISAIYCVRAAGLSPLQLVLLGTAFEMAIFLFEVPTGIIADLYSRRLSVIIGYALIGLGFVLEGLIPHFVPILLAQAVMGVGFTFISGAQEAWLADELGEERLTQAYLRAAQVGQAGSLLGILLGIGLGLVALGLPIVLSGLGLVGLSLFLVLFMPETGFRPAPLPERNTWQKMAHTFSHGLQVVRTRPLLLTMLAVAAFYGLSGEGLDRLWEAHFLANFTFPAVGNLDPLIWFGVINVG